MRSPGSTTRSKRSASPGRAVGTRRTSFAERRQQAGRDALLDALMGLFDEGRTADISVREIAAAAAVSERTVFRYFENRDALRRALIPVIHARLGGIEPPAEVAGLPAYVEALFRQCEANAGLVRSLLHTELGRSVLSEERDRRLAALARMLRSAVAPGRATAATHAAATIRQLASGVGWDFYRHQAKLPLPDAIQAATTAIRCIVSDLGAHCG